MIHPDIKLATPEQQKEIKKSISKAKWGFFYSYLKFVGGLLAINILTMIFGILYLKDTDPQMMKDFAVVSTVINFLFMIRYLDGQLKQNHAKLLDSIKDILKK